jgi:hypothetical protein
MQNEERMTASERELETTLRQLQPLTSGIDPLAMAFAAGRRTRRRSLQAWRTAAAVLAVGFMAVSIRTFRAAPPTEDRALAWHAPVENRPAIRLADADSSYAQIRTRVLENGIAALPSPHSSGSSGVIYRAGDSLSSTAINW